MVKVDTSALPLPWLRGQDLPKQGIDATVMGPGKTDEDGFIVVPVRYKEGKQTKDAQYRPKGMSLGAIVSAWGDETKNWVGLKMKLTPHLVTEGKAKGKFAIDAKPVSSRKE